MTREKEIAWDEVSALYLLEKDMFINHEHRYYVTSRDLEIGYIGNRTGTLTHTVNLPKICDVEAFKEELYASWLRV